MFTIIHNNTQGTITTKIINNNIRFFKQKYKHDLAVNISKRVAIFFFTQAFRLFLLQNELTVSLHIVMQKCR